MFTYSFYKKGDEVGLFDFITRRQVEMKYRGFTKDTDKVIDKFERLGKPLDAQEIGMELMCTKEYAVLNNLKPECNGEYVFNLVKERLKEKSIRDKL